MTDQITPELVQLDADLGADKRDVVRALAATIGSVRTGSDPDRVASDALTREDAGPTGLPGGIAVPHCRTAGVSETVLAFARLARPVDFGAPDGRAADLVFLLAHPAEEGGSHLSLLSRLTRSLVKPAFVDGLRDAESAEDVASILAVAMGQRR